MIVGYCSQTGKEYTLEDVYNKKDCYKKGKHLYCKCHDNKLVKEYPYVIKLC